MDELELEIALDRLLTEFILSVTGKALERQTRIDSFLSVQSLTLSEMEIAGLLTETGSIRIELDAMIRDAIRLYEQQIVAGAQTGLADQQRKEGAEKEWTWQVESGRPCPDCNARDGETHSYEYWESVGLPQSGTTICGANCKCVLIES